MSSKSQKKWVCNLNTKRILRCHFKIRKQTAGISNLWCSRWTTQASFPSLTKIEPGLFLLRRSRFHSSSSPWELEVNKTSCFNQWQAVLQTDTTIRNKNYQIKIVDLLIVYLSLKTSPDNNGTHKIQYGELALHNNYNYLHCTIDNKIFFDSITLGRVDRKNLYFYDSWRQNYLQH